MRQNEGIAIEPFGGDSKAIASILNELGIDPEVALSDTYEFAGRWSGGFAVDFVSGEGELLVRRRVVVEHKTTTFDVTMTANEEREWLDNYLESLRRKVELEQERKRDDPDAEWDGLADWEKELLNDAPATTVFEHHANVEHLENEVEVLKKRIAVLEAALRVVRADCDAVLGSFDRLRGDLQNVLATYDR